MKLPSLRSRGRVLYALCVLAALAAAALSGRWAATEGKRALEARLQAVRVSSEAGALRAREAQCAAALERFRAAARPLARDPEAGRVLSALGDAASRALVRVVLLEPSPRVEGFFKGHLRAVPYRLEAVGSGPGMQAFLALCESLPYPGEVRVFSLAADDSPGAPPGQVRASCLLLLYSTNPPLEEDLLSPPRARADVWLPPASWSPPAPAGPEPASGKEVPPVEGGTGVPAEAGR
ncbi:MAG: hypothetical protein AB1503_00710 [Bacillota bacterium]|nr:hypothetical protein [Bacillota bacterium]